METPLLVELLEAAEGGNHVVLSAELLGFGHEKCLLRKVLLEIIVAELLVDFELVVEFLHGVLIALPELGGNGGGHLADFLEFILQVANLLEEAVGVVHVAAHFENLLYDGLLAVTVFLLLGLDSRTLLGFFLFDGCKKGLESLFGLIRLGLEGLRLVTGLDESFALAALLLVADGVELLFQARHFLVCDFGSLFLRQEFQGFEHTFLSGRLARRSILSGCVGNYGLLLYRDFVGCGGSFSFDSDCLSLGWRGRFGCC